ncbi:unnamed protein product [Dovyalis caffra]|uniref:Uncharacterized protein n=1 Tax=Dovyalis caffra TaxID=77055 RepID=A0AAV1SG09_9ROSI|nr:unnamed protein product [Dovyalis caffra]
MSVRYVNSHEESSWIIGSISWVLSCPKVGNHLFGPVKKKKVLSEKEYNLFWEGSSSEYELGNFVYSSKGEGGMVLSLCKRKRNSSSDGQPQNQEVVPEKLSSACANDRFIDGSGEIPIFHRSLLVIRWKKIVAQGKVIVTVGCGETVINTGLR